MHAEQAKVKVQLASSLLEAWLTLGRSLLDFYYYNHKSFVKHPYQKLVWTLYLATRHPVCKDYLPGVDKLLNDLCERCITTWFELTSAGSQLADQQLVKAKDALDVLRVLRDPLLRFSAPRDGSPWALYLDLGTLPSRRPASHSSQEKEQPFASGIYPKLAIDFALFLKIILQDPGCTLSRTSPEIATHTELYKLSTESIPNLTRTADEDASIQKILDTFLSQQKSLLRFVHSLPGTTDDSGNPSSLALMRSKITSVQSALGELNDLYKSFKGHGVADQALESLEQQLKALETKHRESDRQLVESLRELQLIGSSDFPTSFLTARPIACPRRGTECADVSLGYTNLSWPETNPKLCCWKVADLSGFFLHESFFFFKECEEPEQFPISEPFMYLSQLVLKNCSLEDSIVGTLVKAISQLPMLEVLNLQRNWFSSCGAIELFSKLSGNSGTTQRGSSTFDSSLRLSTLFLDENPLAYIPFNLRRGSGKGKLGPPSEAPQLSYSLPWAIDHDLDRACCVIDVLKLNPGEARGCVLFCTFELQCEPKHTITRPDFSFGIALASSPEKLEDCLVSPPEEKLKDGPGDRATSSTTSKDTCNYSLFDLMLLAPLSRDLLPSKALAGPDVFSSSGGDSTLAPETIMCSLEAVYSPDTQLLSVTYFVLGHPVHFFQPKLTESASLGFVCALDSSGPWQSLCTSVYNLSPILHANALFEKAYVRSSLSGGIPPRFLSRFLRFQPPYQLTEQVPA